MTAPGIRDLQLVICNLQFGVFRVSSGSSTHPYKGQDILIAESAEAARRNAKVFLSHRPFEFDAVGPGCVCGRCCDRLLSSARSAFPLRASAFKGCWLRESAPSTHSIAGSNSQL
jgi:hypothetical protein